MKQYIFNIFFFTDIGYINIYGDHVTANNSTTDNIEFFFGFRFENSTL